MRIFVKVKPLAREEKVEKIDENNYKVEVQEPPVQGKANKAVIEALAKHFSCAQYNVKIVSGFASRLKTIEINV